MRNRSLIFSLVASSLFIPSVEALESTNDFDSLENENNIGINILIAEGGGGGSSQAEKKKKAAQQAKAKINTLKKILAKQEAAGKDTTRTKQLINLNQQLIDEQADGYYEDEKEVNIPIGEGEGDDPRSRGLIPDSLVPKEPTKVKKKKVLPKIDRFFGDARGPKEPDTEVKEKKVLPKIDPIFNDARAPKEKIAISKLDDVGTSFRGGLVKEQIKKLTAKIANSSISNISAKIVKLQDEAKNINPANIDEWLKKTDEIALKIAALEDLQKRIDDHLNYIIDSVVYCIKFMDNPLLKTEGVKVLQKKAIYMDNYYSLLAKAEPAGIIDAELGRALKDMNLLTTLQFEFAYRVNSKS